MKRRSRTLLLHLMKLSAVRINLEIEMVFAIFIKSIKHLTVHLTVSEEVLGVRVKKIGENKQKSYGVVAQLG
jgi:hypothetical protein